MDAIKLAAVTDALTTGAKFIVATVRACMGHSSDIDGTAKAFAEAASKVANLVD